MQKHTTPTQVVILSGGKGERLLPITARMNKGMVKVAGKPLLEHLVELFKKNGIKRFLILTGHAPKSITDYFGGGKRFGVEISYRHAPAEWNHGKRLADALSLVDDFFLLHRNDIYWPFDIKKHIARYRALGLPAMMTVYRNRAKDGIYGPYNNVRINEKGIIERYDNLLSADSFYHGQDIGFFLLTKKAVEENLPSVVPESYCLHHEFLSGLARQGLLGAFETDIPATTTTDAEWLKKAGEYLAALSTIQRQRQRNEHANRNENIRITE